MRIFFGSVVLVLFFVWGVSHGQPVSPFEVSAESVLKVSGNAGKITSALDLLGKMDAVRNVVKKIMESNYSPLTKVDQEILASPQGLPRLPSACKAVKRCWDCYKSRSPRKIEDINVLLIKARAIYIATKDFVTDAVAFGDAMASLPGFGVGWPSERKKILDSFKDFKAKYNRKIDEFIMDLELAMKALSECEREHLGTEDWFERYGILYVDFVRYYYRAK